MSHLQAYHTSCRKGLEGIVGFQVNAASPQLTREQLAAMARAHARYDAPSDMPYEPTAEQMRAFPVALKLSIDPALGLIVSRTQYVGREYRGRDGAPDEGRFGNYFCHMVVGGDAANPFDGLAAVELWDAPHWTSTESADIALPALGPLAPGPVDVANVLNAVAAAPAGVGAALLDGALRALDGGTSVLVVDPVASRAVTWLAWMTFALPTELAGRLTFSTFEGRPERTLSLHVVATIPSCEGGSMGTGRFTRVDVTEPPVGGGTSSLYARAAAALAAAGPEALAGAVRQVRGEDLVQRGASLAIVGRVTELVTEVELPAVLRHLIVLVRSGRVADAAEAAAAVPPSPGGDRAAIAEWAELHLQARRSTAGDPARELASAALTRLVTNIDALPSDLAPVPATAPSAPGVGAIGSWLRATEAAQGTDASGELVQHGVRLGLLGLNVPVDTRLSKVIVHDLGRPAMNAALDAIDRDGTNDHVIKEVTELVAEEPQTDPVARQRLLVLSRYEMAQQTIRRRAEELRTFDANAAWQRVRVASNPALRADAALVLAVIANDAAAYAEIRELWGPQGPQTEADMSDLLRAYIDSSVPVPQPDMRRALQLLVSAPLPDRRPPPSSIGWTIAKLPPAIAASPAMYAWGAAFERPPFTSRTLEVWAAGAAEGLAAPAEQLPDERWDELVAIVAETLVEARLDRDLPAALKHFSTVREFPNLCAEYGHRIGELIHDADDRPQAAAVEFERCVRVRSHLFYNNMLPTALERLSGREIEAARGWVPEYLLDAWDVWVEEHPRTGARAALGRVFGRSKDKDKDNDQ